MRHWLFPFSLVATMAFAQDLNTLSERYFNEYLFALNPTQATSAGVHDYDSKLEDYSRAGVDRAVKVLHGFEREFLALKASPDRDLVLSKIRAELLELEVIRGWEKNPDRYSSGISSSAFTIMSRKFAPPEVRLRALVEREKQMPGALAAARANLKNPPRVYTEVAIEQIPGIVSFFQKDVPDAFKDVKDAALLAEFGRSNQAVIAALDDYGKFLKSDLLPRSNGDFRIGEATYREKLAYDEMVDTPLNELLRRGYEDLRRNQEALCKLQVKMDGPPPDKLLDAFRGVLGGLRDFIVQHNIVTIPSTVPPILEETPPFMRALTFASMDTPGPFEKVAKEAFFNVTLPEKSWTPQQVAEHMEAFNWGVINSTAIHEAYPGHYVQFLWIQQAPSKIRKLIGCSSNSEGWAHYTEQMMLDEGYGNGDPKLRYGQLQDALLRNARYIVGIEMHTGKMTFDQAVDFFVNEGYQTRMNALRETKRGTSDPTYLVYTLGKLEIMKLRDDYRRKYGASFSLRQFHDAFLAQGYPPIKLVRQALGL